MKMPLVSIVVPLFNCEQFVERCILSVQQQSYKNWELIVIDDCSSDGGLEIVRKLVAEDQRCRIIQNETNHGPAFSRNVGINASNGQYISFLDADDQWHSEKLERQVRFMSDNRVALSYTDYSVISENGALIRAMNNPPKLVNYELLLRSNFIGCLTAMYDVSILGKVYMPQIQKRQDYGLWLKILKRVDYAFCVPGQPLATYTAREQSVSSNKMSLLKYNWMLFRHEEKLPFHRSLLFLLSNVYYKLLK